MQHHSLELLLVVLFIHAISIATIPAATSVTSAAVSLQITPARTEQPLRSVSPHFISFALDNAFVRDPTGISGVVLPQDATNSTRIDFQDPLLNKVMPLVGGGYIRIGGTYTDFVHYYVPGSNFTKCPYAPGVFDGPNCPGNSAPCCLPLTMDRWTEALEAAHRWGMRVVFNLNILHGRFEDYSERGGASPGPPPPAPGKPPIPPWDSSQARALMEWTAQHVEPAKWPAAFGLGNELNGYIFPETWAADSATMHKLVQETFGKQTLPHPESERLKSLFDQAGSMASIDEIPSTYGPCCGYDSVWSVEYLNNLSTINPSALGAFSFHTYDHNCPMCAEVSAVADMRNGGIDASYRAFATAAAIHASTNTSSELWITETAFSVDSPIGAGGGGAKASIDGMCRAADIAWNLDALGAAAELGVDVFCRETLCGDWLEVIGLWQPGDARTNENNRPYTPHPDFWIAALWRNLMGTRVLGTTVTNTTATVATHGGASEGRDQWVMAPGFSCNFGEPYNGSSVVKFLGTANTSEDCKAKCAALNDTAAPCKSFSYCSAGCGGEWSNTCYGRLDDKWELLSVPAATSGCDKAFSSCAVPTAVRTFAHCSKNKRGAVMFAVVATPCKRNSTIDLEFPGATQLTVWWLSALSPADDMLRLNGQNLSVSVSEPLPALAGAVHPGDHVTMPFGDECTVGFVEAVYETPVEACLK